MFYFILLHMKPDLKLFEINDMLQWLTVDEWLIFFC